MLIIALGAVDNVKKCLDIREKCIDTRESVLIAVNCVLNSNLFVIIICGCFTAGFTMVLLLVFLVF